MSVSITKLQNLMSIVAETVSSFGRSKVGPKQTPESGKKLMNWERRTVVVRTKVLGIHQIFSRAVGDSKNKEK